MQIALSSEKTEAKYWCEFSYNYNNIAVYSTSRIIEVVIQ